MTGIGTYHTALHLDLLENLYSEYSPNGEVLVLLSCGRAVKFYFVSRKGRTAIAIGQPMVYGRTIQCNAVGVEYRLIQPASGLWMPSHIDSRAFHARLF